MANKKCNCGGNLAKSQFEIEFIEPRNVMALTMLEGNKDEAGVSL